MAANLSDASYGMVDICQPQFVVGAGTSFSRCALTHFSTLSPGGEAPPASYVFIRMVVLSSFVLLSFPDSLTLGAVHKLFRERLPSLVAADTISLLLATRRSPSHMMSSMISFPRAMRSWRLKLGNGRCELASPSPAPLKRLDQRLRES